MKYENVGSILFADKFALFQWNILTGSSIAAHFLSIDFVIG